MSQAVFNAAELAAATGGYWQNIPPEDLYFSINTDSRTIQSGECFLAIAGERFDGHDFLTELPAGTVAIARKDRAVPPELPVLLVTDTIHAYQSIARFHRLRMKDLQVAAVTGSVGKTSVKEMLRAIFTEAAGADRVLYTIGNTNNQIGVPQNLLRLDGKIRYAVIEMGTNHHGEIAPLSRCALPDAAIINTIAACHLEHLGDLDGVAKEKSAIYSALNPAGCAVYPAECAGKSVIEHATEKFRCSQFGSSPEADVSAEYIDGSLNGSRVRLHFRKLDKSCEFSWELTGRHQAANASAAAAAALALGIAPEVIARGLSNTTLPGKRMNSVSVNGTTWINDAYNANPHSMQSSLQCIADNTPHDGKLLLVLGDMLELGSSEISYHEQVLEFVCKKFQAHDYTLLLLGKRFKAASEELGLTGIRCFDTLEDITSAIEQIKAPGMTIFLKSSNSVGLSRVEPC